MEMEYKGLWEEDTSNDTPKTIYTVTEFYDWHNCDPEIDTTIFLGKGLAERYMSKRMREIPNEMFDGYSLDRLNTGKNPNGSTYIHNDNDYWTISIKKDEIVTSVFPCVFDIEEDYEKQAQKYLCDEHNRISVQNYDDSFFNNYCHPYHRETSLFESEK